jgi:hypothetical protein
LAVAAAAAALQSVKFPRRCVSRPEWSAVFRAKVERAGIAKKLANEHSYLATTKQKCQIIVPMPAILLLQYITMYFSNIKTSYSNPAIIQLWQ